MFFKKEFKSTKKKNPDIFSERKKIFSSKNKNLTFLLNKRFYWMEKHLKGKKIIIELGSGNGCIKKIIKTKYRQIYHIYQNIQIIKRVSY